VKGKLCGRIVSVRTNDVHQGRTKSCHHHGKGWFNSRTFKIPSRIFRGGEWWILLKRAQRIMKVSRSVAKAGIRKHARRRAFPEGLGGQAITYAAEKDVLILVDDRLQRKEFPVVPGYISLDDASEQLGRSKERIREVVRDVFGQRLPKYKARRIDGRGGMRAYVPEATLQRLMTYFAEQPAVHLQRMKRRWSRGTNGTAAIPAAGGDGDRLEPVISSEVKTERRVVLGVLPRQVIVDGKEKKLRSDNMFDVVKALVDAWPNGLWKDELEKVDAGARRILRTLRRDPDWFPVIVMPGRKCRGYRVL
jgi:hypothetical protein